MGWVRFAGKSNIVILWVGFVLMVILMPSAKLREIVP